MQRGRNLQALIELNRAIELDRQIGYGYLLRSKARLALDHRIGALAEARCAGRPAESAIA